MYVYRIIFVHVDVVTTDKPFVIRNKEVSAAERLVYTSVIVSSVGT